VHPTTSFLYTLSGFWLFSVGNNNSTDVNRPQNNYCRILATVSCHQWSTKAKYTYGAFAVTERSHRYDNRNLAFLKCYIHKVCAASNDFITSLTSLCKCVFTCLSKTNLIKTNYNDLVWLFWYIFGGPECVGHYFTQSLSINFSKITGLESSKLYTSASRRATNLAPHLIQSCERSALFGPIVSIKY
jgi:hypothetical protein